MTRWFSFLKVKMGDGICLAWLPALPFTSVNNLFSFPSGVMWDLFCILFLLNSVPGQSGTRGRTPSPNDSLCSRERAWIGIRMGSNPYPAMHRLCWAPGKSFCSHERGRKHLPTSQAHCGCDLMWLRWQHLFRRGHIAEAPTPDSNT